MRKLSETYSIKNSITYAKCTMCGEVFFDDLLIYGVIRCPNRCGTVLLRDYKPTKEELDKWNRS